MGRWSPGGIPLFEWTGLRLLERAVRPKCGGCPGSVVPLSCDSVLVVGPLGGTHPPLVADGYSKRTRATVGSPVTLALPAVVLVNHRCPRWSRLNPGSPAGCERVNHVVARETYSKTLLLPSGTWTTVHICRGVFNRQWRHIH